MSHVKNNEKKGHVPSGKTIHFLSKKGLGKRGAGPAPSLPAWHARAG